MSEKKLQKCTDFLYRLLEVMSKKLEKCKTFLLCLLDKNILDIQKEAILSKLSDCQIKSLIEIVYNILQGTVTLSSLNLKKVSKHKNILRKLIDKKKSITFKKHLIKKFRKQILLILKLVQKSLRSYIQ